MSTVDNEWAGPNETYPGAEEACKGCRLSRAGFCLRYGIYLNFTPQCIDERSK